MLSEVTSQSILREKIDPHQERIGCGIFEKLRDRHSLPTYIRRSICEMSRSPETQDLTPKT